MKRKNLWTAAVLSAAVLMTACGSGNSARSGNYAAQTTAAAMDYQVDYEAGYEERDGLYAVEETAAGTGAGASQGLEGSQLTSDTGSMTPLPQGRKLIRNVDMNVETSTFEELISGLQADIASTGGYIEQSNIAGNSLNYLGEAMPRYANITARIPSDKLDSFVATVEKSGNVTNKSQTTQDVTLAYSDIESRKKSLTIEQDRIWALLEKAESIDTVITLEQRLSDIRYELESMESKLRLYDNQVDYSTVYLNISEVTKLTPAAPETTGTRILKGLSQNFINLVNALTNLLVTLITTIPYWVPLLLIVLLVIRIIRRTSARRPHNTPEAHKGPDADPDKGSDVGQNNIESASQNSDQE